MGKKWVENKLITIQTGLVSNERIFFDLTTTNLTVLGNRDITCMKQTCPEYTFSTNG